MSEMNLEQVREMLGQCETDPNQDWEAHGVADILRAYLSLTAERDALREAVKAWWGLYFFESLTDEPGWYSRLQAKNEQQVRAIALTKPLLTPAEVKP